MKTASGSPVAITANGNRMIASSSSWSMLGAETVGGNNQVIWGHVDGGFYRYDMNSSWGYSGGDYISGANLSTAETNFNQDFNNDGCIANDPLIFDLDGDGIEMLDLEVNINFDVDVDGEREITGWVAPDDALLVFNFLVGSLNALARFITKSRSISKYLVSS